MSTRQRRILFVLSGLGMGGAEKLLISLINRFDKSQFLMNVISLSNNNPLAEQIVADGIRFTALPRKWRYDLQPAREIRRIIIENQIDLVVAFNLFCFFYIWYALLRIRNKPRVFISIHNTRVMGLKRLLLSMIYVRLLSGEEKFISVCDAQADYWSKVYGIPRKRFTTVYNGVDVGYFHSWDNTNVRNLTRSSLSIPEDALVILQVASITPHKRHEDSLLALRSLMDLNPGRPCYLLFVGQGPEDREHMLKAMAESLMISDLVRFCGLQNDVRPFYQAADIFTLSSQFVETFSIAALEAMSMGLPCVLTNVGGACEMIVEGMNGYLVPPHNPRDLANAWLRTYENRDSFDHEKIRMWVTEHFDLTGCVQKYEMLLK